MFKTKLAAVNKALEADKRAALVVENAFSLAVDDDRTIDGQELIRMGVAVISDLECKKQRLEAVQQLFKAFLGRGLPTRKKKQAPLLLPLQTVRKIL